MSYVPNAMNIWVWLFLAKEDMRNSLVEIQNKFARKSSVYWATRKWWHCQCYGVNNEKGSGYTFKHSHRKIMYSQACRRRTRMPQLDPKAIKLKAFVMGCGWVDMMLPFPSVCQSFPVASPAAIIIIFLLVKIDCLRIKSEDSIFSECCVKYLNSRNGTIHYKLKILRYTMFVGPPHFPFLF